MSPMCQLQHYSAIYIYTLEVILWLEIFGMCAPIYSAIVMPSRCVHQVNCAIYLPTLSFQ